MPPNVTGFETLNCGVSLGASLVLSAWVAGSFTPPKEPPEAAEKTLPPLAGASVEMGFASEPVLTLLPPKVTGSVT